MALILKRKKPSNNGEQRTDPVKEAEGTVPNFLADANEATEGNRATATAPKKLVIKGKKTPVNPPEAPDKAPEPAQTAPIVQNKAVRRIGPAKCSFCGYERTNPCHGSKEWRGSTAADGSQLECADKRLVIRLRSEGKDQFGKPLQEQRERDAKDDCASGLHSWSDVEGPLDPSCECKFCGAQVGEAA